MSEFKNCPDCEVEVGQVHKLGCDVGRCPYCGGQLLTCEHYRVGAVDPPPQDDRVAWTGTWPGDTGSAGAWVGVMRRSTASP